MKKLSKFLLLSIVLSLVFWGCQEKPNAPQEDSNSQSLYKGTETLGNPEDESPKFLIAEGTGFVEVGIGMNTPPPGQPSGTGNLNVPGTVQQAIIYWAGGDKFPTTIGDDQIKVNGFEVTGTLIGGVASFAPIGDPPVSFYSFRADITGLVEEGDNTFEITEMSFTQQTDGASIVVIYDDGVSPFADIMFRDGLDLAFSLSNPDADATVKQSFTFASAPVARTADLHLIVGSVKENRANVTRVWVDGTLLPQYNDLFYSADGKDWDSPILEVDIPANATTLDVQLFSERPPMSTNDPDEEENPASLLWITAALSIDTPEENEVCGRMTGGGSIFLNNDRGNRPRVTHGFEIHCDLRPPNNIEVNWPGGENFHLTELTYAECLDTEINQTPPHHAPFDTFIGKGYGKYNNVTGAYIEFTFVDAGEPGRNDTAEITIWAPDANPETDEPVLYVNGNLDRGNHQTHRDNGCGN